MHMSIFGCHICYIWFFYVSRQIVVYFFFQATSLLQQRRRHFRDWIHRRKKKRTWGKPFFIFYQQRCYERSFLLVLNLRFEPLINTFFLLAGFHQQAGWSPASAGWALPPHVPHRTGSGQAQLPAWPRAFLRVYLLKIIEGSIVDDKIKI